MAKLLKPIQFIKAEYPRGQGTTEDPRRTVEQYFTIEGVLVFEYDVHRDATSMTGNMLQELRKLD